MPIIMSLLRIVFGVLVSIGIFVGIGVLGRYFPGITAFIFLWLFGAFMAWKILHSLKTGKMAINARTKFVAYGRDSIEFWFYIFIFGFVGALSFCGGVYCLFHLPK